MDYKDTYSATERFLSLDYLAFSDEARFVLYAVLTAISTDTMCDTIQLEFSHPDDSVMSDAVKLGIALAIRELHNHTNIRTKTGSFLLICETDIIDLEDGVAAVIGITPCFREWAICFIGRKYQNDEKAIKRRAKGIHNSIDFRRLFDYSEKEILCSYSALRRLAE